MKEIAKVIGITLIYIISLIVIAIVWVVGGTFVNSVLNENDPSCVNLDIVSDTCMSLLITNYDYAMASTTFLLVFMIASATLFMGRTLRKFQFNIIISCILPALILSTTSFIIQPKNIESIIALCTLGLISSLMGYESVR